MFFEVRKERWCKSCSWKKEILTLRPKSKASILQYDRHPSIFAVRSWVPSNREQIKERNWMSWTPNSWLCIEKKSNFRNPFRFVIVYITPLHNRVVSIYWKDGVTITKLYWNVCRILQPSNTDVVQHILMMMKNYLLNHDITITKFNCYLRDGNLLMLFETLINMRAPFKWSPRLTWTYKIKVSSFTTNSTYHKTYTPICWISSV